MSKKKSALEELTALMAQYDPEVQRLAELRASSRAYGNQLYDYRTGKLKPHIRDEIQAIEILTLARKIAEVKHGYNLKFSARESRTLKGYGTPQNLSVQKTPL